MNSEERRLADWLHAATPEPPHRLTVEQILAPEQGTRGRRWRWAPLLAAAGVVLLVVAVVVVVTLRGTHQSLPAGPPSVTTAPTPSSRATSPTTASPAPPGTRVGAWGATMVGDQPLGLPWLLGVGDSLYGSDGTSILRLDPSSGRVLARHAGVGPAWAPVVAGNTLWILTQSVHSGAVTLQGFDPATLRQAASLSASFSSAQGMGEAVQVAVSPRDQRLFVGLGDQVAVVDPATGQVVRRITVAGPEIVDLAFAPDGSRLYVAADTHGYGQLEVVDPASGATLGAGPRFGANIVNNVGLTASAGGAWVQTGSGHTDDVQFVPANDLAHPTGSVDEGGGGVPVTVLFAAGATWLGGPNRIVCADTRTGRVRAAAQIPPAKDGSTASIGGLASADGHLFGLYLAGSPSGRLVRLSPPAQCTR